MNKLPRLTGKDILKALAHFNFEITNWNGSHCTMTNKQGRHPVRVIVPCHSQELCQGTIQHIVSDAGLNREEFIKFFN